MCVIIIEMKNSFFIFKKLPYRPNSFAETLCVDPVFEDPFAYPASERLVLAEPLVQKKDAGVVVFPANGAADGLIDGSQTNAVIIAAAGFFVNFVEMGHSLGKLEIVWVRERDSYTNYASEKNFLLPFGFFLI